MQFCKQQFLLRNFRVKKRQTWGSKPLLFQSCRLWDPTRRNSATRSLMNSCLLLLLILPKLDFSDRYMLMRIGSSTQLVWLFFHHLVVSATSEVRHMQFKFVCFLLKFWSSQSDSFHWKRKKYYGFDGQSLRLRQYLNEGIFIGD